MYICIYICSVPRKTVDDNNTKSIGPTKSRESVIKIEFGHNTIVPNNAKSILIKKWGKSITVDRAIEAQRSCARRLMAV
jgi:hypothetical protein